MNLDKHKLQVRLTVIMSKEDYNFFTSLNDYQLKLKEYFLAEYSLDEIENALHEIEEAYVEDEFERERAVIEIPEDFDL